MYAIWISLVVCSQCQNKEYLYWIFIYGKKKKIYWNVNSVSSMYVFVTLIIVALSFEHRYIDTKTQTHKHMNKSKQVLQAIFSLLY